MLNPHQFQQFAKQFRSGRISLQQLSDKVFDGFNESSHVRKSRESRPENPDSSCEFSCASASEESESNSSLPRIPMRAATIHKGDAGRVLVIGGSQGMAGAIGMTGLAALRAGAGLVKVAVPDGVDSLVAAVSPCLMTVSCPGTGGTFSEAAGDGLLEEASWSNVVAVGPGMGRGEAQQKIVSQLYADVPQALVVDADALNALSDAGVDLSRHAGDRVLTPHPGEFQRLVGVGAESRCDQERAAASMARSANVVVVLKGSRTFVTDGTNAYRNETGNPGMATAGSGDVLTGVISALVGQGCSVFDASKLGVYLHGVAGDFAAETWGEFSMIATDLIASLAGAFKKHAGESGSPIGF